MKFRVVAHEPADFEAWVQGELAQAAAPEAGSLAEQVLPTCLACHSIQGVGGPDPDAPPPPIVGPDLTHVGSRQTLAAGKLPNTEDGLATWLSDPPAVKAGSKMPDYNLTGDEIDALVEYLRSLK
jgi:cytochrome c oxidase subunit 2